jgi:hypothetical protein
MICTYLRTVPSRTQSSDQRASAGTTFFERGPIPVPDLTQHYLRTIRKANKWQLTRENRHHEAVILGDSYHLERRLSRSKGVSSSAKLSPGYRQQASALAGPALQAAFCMARDLWHVLAGVSRARGTVYPSAAPRRPRGGRGQFAQSSPPASAFWGGGRAG